MENNELTEAEPPKRKNGKKKAHEVLSISMLISEYKSGKTTAQIGKIHNYTVQAIGAMCKRHGFKICDLRAYQQAKADVLAHKQEQIIRSITPEKIAQASLRDCATSFNIFHNAERLERGQSTSNVDLQSLSLQLTELDEAELALRKKIEALG